MLISSSRNGNQVTILLPENFNFKLHQQFRRTYEAYDSNLTFILDFAKVQYLDSSTLGMLLIFRDYCGGDNADISLANLSPMVNGIFKTAHFEESFQF